MATLLEELKDTRMGDGAGAYSAALLIYGSLKQAVEAATAGVPGTSTLIEEPNTRFERAVRIRRRNEEEQAGASESTEPTSS